MMFKTSEKNTFCMVGTMSGTSCDGFDWCVSMFEYHNGAWQFEIVEGDTIPYPDELWNQLRHARKLPIEQLLALDAQLGKWMGVQLNSVLRKNNALKWPIHAIGHHGHTVHHAPHLGYSMQIGKGCFLAAETGLPVISNFRMSDIARGGEGAPLAPVGDQLLFPEFSHRLNLGGFCNLSTGLGNTLESGDITACNLLLNFFAEKKGALYDAGGTWAKLGNVQTVLLRQWNALPILKKNLPRSFGTEELEAHFFAALQNLNVSIEDGLRTAVAHIAEQVGAYSQKSGKGLITGGGAKNTFLVEQIRQHSKVDWQVPSSALIDFKEALLFGFLAVLYLKNEPSSFPKTTGVSSNSVNGCLYLP